MAMNYQQFQELPRLSGENQMNPNKSLEEFRSVLDMKGLDRVMARKAVRKTNNTISWIVTAMAVTVCCIAVNSTKDTASYMQSQVKYDTLTVRDTIIVSQTVDFCPVCGTQLPFIVEKEPVFCPRCDRALIRMTENGPIFRIEKP